MSKQSDYIQKWIEVIERVDYLGFSLNTNCALYHIGKEEGVPLSSTGMVIWHLSLKSGVSSKHVRQIYVENDWAVDRRKEAVLKYLNTLLGLY